MTQHILKLALSALIILVVSEVAKRSTLLGALLVSLPLVSLISMTWLWLETKDAARIGEFSWGVFWLVLPSLALFALLPVLLKRGVGYWIALAVASVATAGLYLLMIVIMRRFGIAS